MAFLDALLGGLKGVANASTPLPPEPTVNFTGSGVTVTDDPTNGQTTVNIPGGAASSRIYVLPQTFGAVGNGSTDDSGAFTTMIGANAGKDILVGDGTFLLGNNVTFNANQNIYFQNGAILSIASGKTLTVGKINANLTQQLFSGSGTVTLPANTVASPMWWGAKGDGATDDAPAFAQAIASGANLEIPAGTYKLNSNVTFDATKEVKFHAGAILDRGSAVLVNVNSHIDSPQGAQIFTPGWTITGASVTAGFMVGQANASNLWAYWWGAKADNSNDDYSAIQTGLVAAYNLTLAYQALGSRPGDFAAPTVRLLPGRHKILSTLQMNWGTSFVGAEGRTSFVTDDSGTISLLRTAGNGTITRGVVFERGTNSVIYGGFSSVFGANIGNFAANGNFRIENCALSDAQGPAIFQDTTVQLRSDTAFLTVENCSFYGACMYFGVNDQVCFKDCEVLFDPQAATLTDGSGVPLACFNCSGLVVFDNIIAAPITTITRSCWIQAGSAADVVVRSFRFGGETTAVIFRGRGHNAITYGGSTISNDNIPCSVQFYNCGFSSTAGINAFEFYDFMPTKFDILEPLTAATVSGIQIDDPGSLGVFVDSVSISLATIQALQASNSYKCLGYKSPLQWRYGNDYSSTAGTDISKIMRHVLWREDTDFETPSRGPQNNLGIAGAFDASSGQITISSSNLPTTGTDTTTGYTLTTYTGNSSIATFSFHTQGPAASPAGWGGSNAAAGEYVYSWYMKSTSSGEISVLQNTETKAFIRYTASSNYVRYQYRFYHDGTTLEDIQVALNRIEPNSTFSIGLFAVHKGRDAAPYTFPIDSLSAPTTNTVVQDKTQGIYWATAAPSVGTYKAGDIVWNSSPSAGAPIGWFCEVGGIPGTFQPFGGSATSSVLGQIELNTDLGGSASAPTVVQLTGSAGSVAVPGTTLTFSSAGNIVFGSGSFLNLQTAGFVKSGAAPASTGQYRLSEADSIVFRNHANSSDLVALTSNSSNQVLFGSFAWTFTDVRALNTVSMSLNDGTQFGIVTGGTTSWRSGSISNLDATGTAALQTTVSATGNYSFVFQAGVTKYALNFQNKSSASKAANVEISAQNNTSSGDGGDVILSVGTTGSGAAGKLDIENVSTTTTAPSAGGAGALPATPAGYVSVKINGTSRQIAFY